MPTSTAHRAAHSVQALLLLTAVTHPASGYACSGCVPLVHAAALGPGFAWTLWLLTLPVMTIVLLAVGVVMWPRRGSLPP